MKINTKNTRIHKPSRLFRQLVSLLGLLLFGGIIFSHLLAQAPTDEWRRGGFDAMVAQPGQASSILSNPAGIKTKEERHGMGKNKEVPGKKYEWITEIVSADMFLTAKTWDLLETPSMIPEKLFSKFRLLTSLSKLIADPTASNSSEIVDLLLDITSQAYWQLIKNTGLPSDPTKLTVSDLQNMDLAAGEELKNNLRNGNDLISALSDSLFRMFFEDLGDLGLEYYSRLFSLSHVNDKQPLAWGFYLGFEQKAVFRTNLQSAGMPLDLEIGNISFQSSLPIGLQAYLVTPLRAAFAHDFGEALPGFTFGLGLKMVPYVGMNQKGLGNLVSQSISDSGIKEESKLLSDARNSLGGMNLGLDFGVQYHFGAILPKLEFLHTGLKISDLLGFNVPFSDKGDKFRYALDFDWGLYAEHQFPKYLQVFGGFEIIQLRGLFPGGQSPYSALFDPIDHLRFLVGLGLFDNVLGFTVQYYNNNLSPGITLNLGAFQFQTAFHMNSTTGSWGLELGLRFRSPHDGFNKRTPYKTYTQTPKGPKKETLGTENSDETEIPESATTLLH